MNPENQFWLNWGVQFAVALATFAAAFIALFGQKLREKYLPPLLPILTLRLRSDEGELTQLTDSQTGKFLDDARYYYVLASNSRRRFPAEQTQVFLTRIEVPGPDGELQTKWAADVPMRWRNQEFVPLLRTVGPDIDIDFCRVEKKGKLSLLPLLVPNNFPAVWTGKCTFVATLEARSNLINSRPLRIKVAWDGEWADGVQEMKNQLKIAPVLAPVQGRAR